MADDRPPPGPILITGAGGFVGGHLVRALRAEWPSVAIITPALDVRDADAVRDCIRAQPPSRCVHLAAVSSLAGATQDQDRAWQVNLHGALHVAHAILAHAPECRMLFVSSADAYGASFRSGEALSEAAPLAPMSIYGATKAAADLALGSLVNEGLHLIRLRPFNHIGPGQSAGFVVASFARQIARIGARLQPPVLKVGRLDTFRDFLDVRDVCAAYLACVARADTLPRDVILNIASGRPRRIGDVLGDLISLSGLSPSIETAAPRVRPGDIPHASGDATLAAQLLSWRPVVAWQETLSDILQDWQSRVVQSADTATP